MCILKSATTNRKHASRQRRGPVQGKVCIVHQHIWKTTPQSTRDSRTTGSCAFFEGEKDDKNVVLACVTDG
jgi:hypothetical protein